ncbi:MAG: YaeQ family protein [Betaproteobacteria bacterium]
MALRATIYRCDLTVSDVDRHVYGQHALTLARHPSETEERMMVRLLAFAMHADAALAFGPGLSTEDEPDLILRDPTGVIDLWIDVGLPDEKAVRKACGRARQVVVLAYGARRVDAWWQGNSAALARHANLRVITLTGDETEALQRLAARAMALTCTVQEGRVWLGSAAQTLELAPQQVKAADTR